MWFLVRALESFVASIGENLNEVGTHQKGYEDEDFKEVRMHDLNPLLYGQKA